MGEYKVSVGGVWLQPPVKVRQGGSWKTVTDPLRRKVRLSGSWHPQALPSQIANYQVYSPGSDSSTLTTPSFTPSNGEIFVVKACTWFTGTEMSTPTGGGQSYTQAAVEDPGGFKGYVSIWTTTIAGSPGSMTISSTPTDVSRHSMVVERWNGKLAGGFAAVSGHSSSNGNPTLDMTTTTDNSAISWIIVDEQSTDPTGHAYLLSGTEDLFYNGASGFNSVHYGAYATVGAVGTYSFGMSSPVNQNWTMAGVEIKAP